MKPLLRFLLIARQAPRTTIKLGSQTFMTPWLFHFPPLSLGRTLHRTPFHRNSPQLYISGRRWTPRRNLGLTTPTLRRSRARYTCGRRKTLLDFSSARYYTVRNLAHSFTCTLLICSICHSRNCHCPVLSVYRSAPQSRQSKKRRRQVDTCCPYCGHVPGRHDIPRHRP